jgi:peptide/nickel transport system permease protein
MIKSPFVRFVLRRLAALPVTFIVITMVLYAGVMLTPPETRVLPYVPKNIPPSFTEEQVDALIDRLIERHHLNDSYPEQYLRWLGSLARGDWGYSPALQVNVLEALMQRTPVTLELALYSLLFFLPLGLLSGVIASGRRHGALDWTVRLAASVATTLPPITLAFFLLSIFYVGLKWFPPERLGLQTGLLAYSPEFRWFTGLLTIDGFLNGKPEISLDAARHLVLPVFTLSLYHWATLARITRALVNEELGKEYILSAKARGFSERRVVWRHALKNALAPALASSLLSAASLVTGVFVVEIIYNFPGISELVVRGFSFVPDTFAVLGFAIYSLILVLLLMLVLDLLVALVDPRHREGVQG